MSGFTSSDPTSIRRYRHVTGPQPDTQRYAAAAGSQVGQSPAVTILEMTPEGRGGAADNFSLVATADLPAVRDCTEFFDSRPIQYAQVVGCFAMSAPALDCAIYTGFSAILSQVSAPGTEKTASISAASISLAIRQARPGPGCRLSQAREHAIGFLVAHVRISTNRA